MSPCPTTSTAFGGRRAYQSPFAVLVLGLLVLALTLAGLVALCGCGGSGGITTGSPPASPGGSRSASPMSTPSVALPAERLGGSDSVAATRKVVDAYGSGIAALSGAQLAALYADDVVYDDFVFGLHLRGKAAVLKELRRSLGEADGAGVLASYVDGGYGVVEHRWDFRDSYGVSIQPITVLEIHDQQIVGEAWYYQDPASVSDGRPLAPMPLKSAPGPADTVAAAQSVALWYAAALQARDASALAALSAPRLAFMDTASSTVCTSPSALQEYYASIFAAPAGLAFTHLRYTFGRGWATVMWTAGAPSSGPGGRGVTMLEIRSGKIARETLYYSSSDVPFRP